jgi:hypothetical protein
MLLLNGCASPQRPILQLDGQPISDKIISVSLIGMDPFKIKYQLKKSFKVVEGKEFYNSHEYLSMVEHGIYKVEEEAELSLELIAFNPIKQQFKLVQHTYIEGGCRLETVVYEGELSRKQLSIVLPRANRRTIEVHFEVLNGADLIQYRSFKVRYQYEVFDD